MQTAPATLLTVCIGMAKSMNQHRRYSRAIATSILITPNPMISAFEFADRRLKKPSVNYST
jgi:hypothetical protein